LNWAAGSIEGRTRRHKYPALFSAGCFLCLGVPWSFPHLALVKSDARALSETRRHEKSGSEKSIGVRIERYSPNVDGSWRFYVLVLEPRSLQPWLQR
jgi:hypothetical protein